MVHVFVLYAHVLPIVTTYLCVLYAMVCPVLEILPMSSLSYCPWSPFCFPPPSLVDGARQGSYGRCPSAF